MGWSCCLHEVFLVLAAVVHMPLAQFVCNNVPFHPWPWQVLCSLIHPDPPPLPCSQTAAESQALHWLWMQLGTLSSPPLLSWLSKPIADGLYLIHNKNFFFSSEAGFCECERQTVWQAQTCVFIFFSKWALRDLFAIIWNPLIAYGDQ